MLAVVDQIVGGAVGGAVAGAVALGGYWGKRKAQRRAQERLLIRELLGNWHALDAAAEFSVPLGPGEISLAVYRSREEELAGLLPDGEWRLIEAAYSAASEAVDISTSDSAWSEQTAVRIHIDFALQACEEALRALEGTVPARWRDRMEQTQETADRSALEADRAMDQATEYMNQLEEHIAKREDELPDSVKQFSEWLRRELRAGTPVNELSRRVRENLGEKATKADLKKIDEVILTTAKVVRLEKRKETGD